MKNVFCLQLHVILIGHPPQFNNTNFTRYNINIKAFSIIYNQYHLLPSISCSFVSSEDFVVDILFDLDEIETNKNIYLWKVPASQVVLGNLTQ